jgi:GNAT superfamily N-acetyltransferase
VQTAATKRIRACTDRDEAQILEIINEAAKAYRGVIPADRWHEPYMSHEELARERLSSVSFIGMEMNERLVGVMGIQPVGDSDLIRHAYVHPAYQRHGVGSALIRHLLASAHRQILVGTWADAHWAVSFYQRHGFALADPPRTRELLRTYWQIPERQMEVSVVLTRHPSR